MKFISDRDQTILEALAQLSPDSSKTTLRSWLKEGRVSVNGQTVKLSTAQVLKYQVVTVGVRIRYLPGDLRLYYEDQHIVVLEKPIGLLSVAAAFDEEETVHKFLKNHYKPRKVYVVHRLDQDTSGVMLFALSEEAYNQLKVDFEKHDIERHYTAVVEGQLQSDKGTWRSYLYEDSQYVVHSTQNPTEGRLAVTHYEVTKRSKQRTLLNIRLETGRKNQIRVHCKEAGHPVVGDKKYGAQTNPAKRLCLHAHVLGLHHPITKKWMRFQSDPPDIFSKILHNSL